MNTIIALIDLSDTAEAVKVDASYDLRHQDLTEKTPDA